MSYSFQDSDVIWLKTVDSTNEEIKRRVQHFSKPTWIIAEQQTNGKGRNGNSWLSCEGNFMGSVIFFPTIERSCLHLYGFFFGVALYNTIKKIVKEGVDIRLKWPNDLMIDNGKVAGILLESIQISGKNIVGLIVGVGVNLKSSPRLRSDLECRYDAHCVSKYTNNRIDRSSFFSKFNDELILLEPNILEQNLRSVLNFWQARSYDKGSKVKFSIKKGEIKTGTFLGLDELGGLIICENTGIKKIYSGDVYFRS